MTPPGPRDSSLMYELNVQAVVLRRSLTAIQSIRLVPEAHTLPLKPFSPQGASVLISNASVISFLRVCLACSCDWDVMKGCVSEGIPPCGDGTRLSAVSVQPAT